MRTRAQVEAHINTATKQLEGRVEALKAKEVTSPKALKQDPLWRKLNAEVKKRKLQLAGVERKEAKAATKKG